MDCFSDWCCRLTGTSSLNKETIEGFGIIVQLAGDLHAISRLPGLKKVGEIKSDYALLTCHSIIPGSEESLKINWSLRSKATGSTKSPKLNSFVSGAISCCGEKSLFGPGENYSLKEHPNDVCSLGLDFTLLFLDSKFESYIKSNPSKCNPPIMTLLQNESPRFHEVFLACSGNGSVASSSQPTNDKSSTKVSGTFFISLPTIDTDYTNQLSCLPISVKCSEVDSNPYNEPKRKILKLEQEITQYQVLKRINYTHIGDASIHSCCPGMPIAYQSASSGATPELTGILVQSPNGLVCITIYGIAKLIQGGPVSCLSILTTQAADRLWANKWSYLILPYLLEETVLDTRHVLEILQMFLIHQLLKTNRKDLLPTREAVLTLIGALFRHFKNVSQDKLMKAIEDTFGAAEVRTKFLTDLSSLCASVVENVNDANRYPPKQETTQLVKACFYSVAMMLNFNDIEGIVSREFMNDSFLETLQILGGKYAETAAVQSHLASVYSKCLSDMQRRTQGLTEAHKEEVEKLTRNHVQAVTELEKKCHVEQDKLCQKEKDCIALKNLLKQEQGKLKEQEKRFKEELNKESAKSAQKTKEAAALKEQNDSSRDELNVMEERCKKQSEKLYSMKLELTQSHKTIHTQVLQLANKDAQTQRIADLERDNDALAKQLEELQTEASDLREKNESLVSQLEVLQKSARTSQQKKPRGYMAATPPHTPRKTSTPSPIGTTSVKDTSPTHSGVTTASGKQRKTVRSSSESWGSPKPSESIRRTGSDSKMAKYSTTSTTQTRKKTSKK